MKEKQMKNIVWLLALAIVSPTFAAEYDCGGTCDLPKLVKICKALEGDAQVKPFTTEIKCGGSNSYWETAGSSTYPLGTKQNVTTKISMKGGKYTIPDSTVAVPGAPTQGECSTYKEFVGFHAPVSKILYSCAELEAVQKVGQIAYCKKVISDSGSQLVEVKPTGKTYTNCPTTATPTTPGPTPGEEPAVGSSDLGGEFTRVKVEGDGGYWFALEVTSLASETGLLGRLGMKLGDQLSSVNAVQISESAVLDANLAELKAKGEKTVTVIFFQKSTLSYVQRTATL